VFDLLIQSRRDKKAAKKFFRKLLKGLQYVPRLIITDKLGSYSAAKAEVMPDVEHRRHKWFNNEMHRHSRSWERFTTALTGTKRP
jgi:putative transposase